MNNYALMIALSWAFFIQPLPSCTAPLRAIKDITIDLTQDIEIVGTGSPFLADESFGSKKAEKIIISSKTGNAVIVRKLSVWDLRSFTTKNQIIEFTGNARLVCEPGAELRCNGGLLRFSGSSRLIIE